VSPEWTALAARYYNTLGFVGAFAASLLFGVLVDWSGSFALGWLWLALAPVVGATAALTLAIPSSPGEASAGALGPPGSS
jgi:cyanate permease